MGRGSMGRLGPAGKGREITRNTQNRPCPSQYKVIFLLLSPGGWRTPLAWAALLAQGSAPRAPHGWGCPSTSACSFSLLWRQKLYFPSHCLCSSGLICPLMDNLSAFGCSGSWEEIHGRVMPSALSGGFGNLTFNLFCGI